MSAPSSSFGAEAHGHIRTVHETDEITALCLDGDFDIGNVSTLRDRVDEAMASGNNLILDLSDATFIDCSVIHVLFDSARAADRGDQIVVLQHCTAPIVERMLEITGIERALPRAHHREEAVRIIRQRAGPARLNRRAASEPRLLGAEARVAT